MIFVEVLEPNSRAVGYVERILSKHYSTILAANMLELLCPVPDSILLNCCRITRNGLDYFKKFLVWHSKKSCIVGVLLFWILCRSTFQNILKYPIGKELP